MVQIYIVNNDDKYELDNINVFSSIYNLKQKFKNTYNKRIKNNNIKTNKELLNKIKNNEFYFTYKGQRLDDDKTLYQYNIKNSEMININYTLPGGSIGSGISSIMIFIISLVVILLFYGFLSSGFISFFAKMYGYSVSILLEKIFQFVYWFFGGKMTDKSSPNVIIKFIENIIILLSIGGFVYVSLYFINNLTFNRIFFEKQCDSLKNAKKVSKISTIVFLIIYFLIQVPDFFFNIFIKITSFISSKLSNKFYIFSKTIEESTTSGKKAYDTLKYLGLFMIPIFGIMLEDYHMILSSIFNGVNTVRNKFSIYNTETGKKRIVDCKKDKIASILNNNTNFKDMLIDYDINPSNITKYLDNISNIDKNTYDNIISNKNLSNNDRKTKLGIKFIYYMICNILKLTSIFTRALDSIGSSTDIINMIMSSSISGSIASIINIFSVLFLGITSFF
jgi:hypothetical protein